MDKKFNKALLTMPVRIDYHIKVPLYIDLDINGGDGNLSISGTLGSMDIKFVKTNARLALNSGLTNATFGSGTVDVVIPNYRWAGRFVGIQLASGTLNVQLPNSLSADVEAKILRTGKIESSYTRFTPVYQSVPFTDKFMDARVGAGGISMKYAVGDGTLNFLETKKGTIVFSVLFACFGVIFAILDETISDTTKLNESTRRRCFEFCLRKVIR